MLTFFNKRLRNRKGFTLIELIVVIGIIGILAAIAVPRLSDFTDQAKDAADEANARVIYSAIVTMEAETGLDFAATTTYDFDGNDLPAGDTSMLVELNSNVSLDGVDIKAGDNDADSWGVEDRQGDGSLLIQSPSDGQFQY